MSSPSPPGPPGRHGRRSTPGHHEMEGEEATVSASREWIQESGYSKRAPVQHVREDVQRSQRQSEEKLRKLRAEQREVGLSHVRSGGSHALGASTAMPMHEARQKFARDLERDSNPRLRKEEERRKAREESQREKELKEQERQRELRSRQQTDAIQNRFINDAKRLRWQAWDASLPRPPTPPPELRSAANPSVRSRIAEIAGTWHLKKGQCYHLFEADGSFYFDGPPLPGSDPNSRLLGRLTSEGLASWRTELYDSRSDQHVGVMSFRLSDSAQHLMSCFKATGKEQWSKETTASREVPTSVASTAASGSEGVRDAMRTNYMDRLIDPSVWQCQTCTFINVNGVLCDVCGSALNLPPDPHVTSMDTENCSEHQVAHGTWECPTCTLENEANYTCCGACETLRPTEDVAVDEAPEITALGAWLRENGLEEYEDSLETQGYADLQDLLDAEPVDIERMLVSIEALPGHILRFKNCLRRSRKN